MKKTQPSKRLGERPGSDLNLWPLAMLFLLSITCSYAQVNLVKDINNKPAHSANEFGMLTNVNGMLYFAVNGNELWKSDGSGVGTLHIKTFNTLRSITYVSGTVFVVADDGVSGYELWKTDGTPEGTIRIKDIAPGSGSSDPDTFTGVNGIAYFIASDGKKGRELWKTDGTSGGTVLVKDIMKGGGHCNCRDMISYNNKLYFVATEGSKGYEVWESDGTLNGTHIFVDIGPGKISSSPGELTVSGNAFYFQARSVESGVELWKSDGTEAGTVIIKDVWPGTTSSFPSRLVDADGRLYFKANDGVHGIELWTSDGTPEGTSLVTDLVRGKTSGYSWINGAVGANGKLYFVLGRTVYRTDGTAAGTQELFSGYDFYDTKEIARVNNDIYIIDNKDTGSDLWKFNEIGASFVRGVNVSTTDPYLYASKTLLTSVGNTLFLVGNTNEENSLSLMKSDGTYDGTVEIKDVIPTTEDSNPQSLTDLNGTLFFNAYNGVSNGLWKSDGTESGTSLVQTFTSIQNIVALNNDLIFAARINDQPNQIFKSNGMSNAIALSNFGYGYPDPGNFTLFKNEIFFTGQTSTSAIGIWKTNGTPAGTVLLNNVGSVTLCCNYVYPLLTNVNDTNLFFSASDVAHGSELWKTDGTVAGTVLVKDIVPGTGSLYILQQVAMNGLLYFLKIDSQYGGYSEPTSLWKSDGTAAGTIRLPAFGSRKTSSVAVLNNELFFVAADEVEPTHTALWKMNAAEVIVKVTDVDFTLPEVSVLSTVGNRIFITVNASTTASALWISDGTSGGTLKISNASASVPIAIDGVFYFLTTQWVQELWRTDGTACGTSRITIDDNLYGYRNALTVSGNKLFFSSGSSLYGQELFSVDHTSIVNPCPLASARTATVSDELNVAIEQNDGLDVRYYPNPYTANFTLRVNGSYADPSYTASITNINGLRIENHSDLKQNVDYAIGSTLSSGIYILRVVVDGKVITRRISKVK